MTEEQAKQRQVGGRLWHCVKCVGTYDHSELDSKGLCEECRREVGGGGRPCEGGDGYAACNLVLTYECTQCGRREAADDAGNRESQTGPRSTAAHGSASLPVVLLRGHIARRMREVRRMMRTLRETGLVSVAVMHFYRGNLAGLVEFAQTFARRTDRAAMTPNVRVSDSPEETSA